MAKIVALVFWLMLLVLAFAQRDFYEILGITRRSTAAQIKKAYRRLSLENHPDKAGNSPEVLKKFQEIAEAYQVLSDTDKKQIYDQSGHEGLKSHNNGQQTRDPFDMFSFFGGGTRQQHEDEKRTPDLEIELQVTLSDLYLGKTFRLSVRNQHVCPKCGGSGARSDRDVVKCSTCQGKGVRTTMRQLMPGFVQQVQSTYDYQKYVLRNILDWCDVCGGKGKVVTAQCPHCRGNKVMAGVKQLTLRLEAGTPDKHKVTLENEGDEQPDIQAGHLVFVVRTALHPIFRREGDDLHVDVHITLAEALLGINKTFQHLDQHPVLIQKNTITRPCMQCYGCFDCVKHSLSMPNYSNSAGRGNLHVRFTIDFPSTLTDAQKEGFAKIL